MTSSPIVVTGGTNASQPGQHVVGSATNNTQTDTYVQTGFNNNFTENGGNLSISPITGVVGLGFNYDTTINLGNAAGVTDTIMISGDNTNVLQEPGTALTAGSKVSVNIQENFAGHDSIDLNNPGGSNQITLYNTPNETVTLVGAINSVSTGSYSTITLNGNSNNNVSTGNSTVTVGSKNDNLFGYTTMLYLGVGSAGNQVFFGDENAQIGAILSAGYNVLSLGDGTNTLFLQGLHNTITTGGGTNTIQAGSGQDTVTIAGLDGRAGPSPGKFDGKEGKAVPRHPNDTVTLNGSGNTVTATYENVTIAGASTTGTAAITLGNGNNTVTLGGDMNTVTVGDGKNAINLTGKRRNRHRRERRPPGIGHDRPRRRHRRHRGVGQGWRIGHRHRHRRDHRHPEHRLTR